MIRMNEAPAIEVHVVKSSEPPGGMGETGTSGVVPAIANAIFAATGKRLRKMPVDRQRAEAASVRRKEKGRHTIRKARAAVTPRLRSLSMSDRMACI